MLLFIFKNATQISLYTYANITCNLPIHNETIAIGLVTGLVIPMLSNVVPIRQALGTSLRNALDRFRQGVDDLEVSVIRMESVHVNMTQVGTGLIILGSSTISLYFIPK
jgi:hypothetical protein